MSIAQKLRNEFALSELQTQQIIRLIDDGNTIPFIARYRKEMTGNLDDQSLRRFAASLQHDRAMAERRGDVCRLIDEQGLLTEALRQAIHGAATLTEIDDLYRPFRPKRRTRGSMARDLGLQPLADNLQQPDQPLSQALRLAEHLVRTSEALPDTETALAGACDILAEQWADQAAVRRACRRLMEKEADIICRKSKDSDPAVTVYDMYGDYQEPVSRVRDHRILAMNRGEREKQLQVRIQLDPVRAVKQMMTHLPPFHPSCHDLLMQTAADCWKRLLFPSLTTELRSELTAKAEEGALAVFSANLRSLLLQPPLRGRTVLGVDPGFRTGCKLAVTDPTGLVLATGVIYPTPPRSAIAESGRQVLELIRRFNINLIAIGNGTASRETEQFISSLVREQGLEVPFLLVSEAGASVYSASPAAAAEFPDYDVSLRSAISIARRVQDPLAELVKIEPQSIGVGQYQHDISEKKLSDDLRGVVEACVNEVGVDLNTASVALLTYVAGLSPAAAQAIVSQRETGRPFASRSQLLSVPKIGPKRFEQCAGFLRVPGSEEILDNTPVHPEAYAQVYQLSEILGEPPSPRLAQIAAAQPAEAMAERLGLGLLTYQDILEALQRPGRDPRDDLPQPVLRSDIMEIGDLKPGMILQGVVRNVADFGAFVDIGVHQDGLVHVSELSSRYVRSPMDIVQTGQPVTVAVLSVDISRRRIALTMKGIEPSKPDGSGQSAT
ncbi:MAG: Tex family protein [Eubacteriales bacterium]|nr:Tex family protein [Eubacteriales bacterium]